MGWNDHVSFEEMRCLDCGEVDTWECWDDVAKARYSGELGKKLGHDIKTSDRCPHCGSSKGEQFAESDDQYQDRCFQDALDKDD